MRIVSAFLPLVVLLPLLAAGSGPEEPGTDGEGELTQVQPIVQKIDRRARKAEAAGIQSFRLACASADIATLTICTAAGECSTVHQPCFPYQCDGSAHTCSTSCSEDGQCWTGTVCFEGRCVIQRAFCDGHTLRNTAGKETDCRPYACDEAAALCRARCTVTADCAARHVCDAALGQCVPGG